MGSNVKSNLWLCNRVIPAMKRKGGGGAIVIISSIAGHPAAIRGHRRLRNFQGGGFRAGAQSRRRARTDECAGELHRARPGEDGFRPRALGRRGECSFKRTSTTPLQPDRATRGNRPGGGIPCFSRVKLHQPSTVSIDATVCSMAASRSGVMHDANKMEEIDVGPNAADRAGQAPGRTTRTGEFSSRARCRYRNPETARCCCKRPLHVARSLYARPHGRCEILLDTGRHRRTDGRRRRRRSDRKPVGAHLRRATSRWACSAGPAMASCRRSELRKIDPAVAPITTALGVLGMPGFTGWYGLTVIGKPKAGETLVVGAATGPVGSMVGQFAQVTRGFALSVSPEARRNAPMRSRNLASTPVSIIARPRRARRCAGNWPKPVRAGWTSISKTSPERRLRLCCR
jgi:hypothetical protein